MRTPLPALGVSCGRPDHPPSPDPKRLCFTPILSLFRPDPTPVFPTPWAPPWGRERGVAPGQFFFDPQSSSILLARGGKSPNNCPDNCPDTPRKPSGRLKPSGWINPRLSGAERGLEGTTYWPVPATKVTRRTVFGKIANTRSGGWWEPRERQRSHIMSTVACATSVRRADACEPRTPPGRDPSPGQRCGRRI